MANMRAVKFPGAAIASVGTSLPPYSMNQREAGDCLIKRYGDRLSPRSLALMKTIFSHSSIARRYFAIHDIESFFMEDADTKIQRFTRWSVDLSAVAITEAITAAGLKTTDIRALLVNTCTGYICPGISTYLIEKLSLPARIPVYDLVGGGCGGVIPNIQIAQALVEKTGGAVVIAAVEICSATFQMEDRLSLIVSNALFGDGAAAAVLWDRNEGLELIASNSYHLPKERDAIRYVHRNGELHNQLAGNLPHIVKKAAAVVVNELLNSHSLSVKDIGHWAIHAGGEKILRTIKEEMGLSELQLQPTREILSDYGNMSSPTSLFVLKSIMERQLNPGEWCVLLTFGAGLSAHASLLKKI